MLREKPQAVLTGIVLTVAFAVAAFVSVGCGGAPAHSSVEQLAYSLSSRWGGIVLVNSDASGRRWLAHPRPRVDFPASCPIDAQWAPAGEKILLAAAMDVTNDKADFWTVNSDGTALSPFAKGENASWSPDGSRVAVGFVGRQDELRLYRATGKLQKILPLGDFEDVLTDFEWSPDGRSVAFSGPLGWTGAYGVYVLDLRGGGPRLLTPRGTSESWPVWSPDGRWIALTRDRFAHGEYSGARIDVLVMRSDGSQRSLLVANEKTSDDGGPSALAWSPDGSALILKIGRSVYRRSFADGSIARLFTLRKDSNSWGLLPSVIRRGTSIWLRYDAQFFILDRAGQFVRRVDPPDRDLELFSVSPDAKWLLGSKHCRLTAVRVDGSRERALTPDPVDEFESAVSWTSHGTALAFTRFALSGERSGNFVLRSDASGEHRIGDGWSPRDLSPNAKSVLVSSKGSVLKVRSLDGRPDRVVARGRIRDAIWSPDGQTIAFVRDEGYPVGHDSFQISNSVLYTVRRDGSDLRQIYDSVAYSGDTDSQLGKPAWTADGKSVLVSEYRSTVGGRLRRIELDGSSGLSTDVEGEGVVFESAVFSTDGSRAALVSDKGIEAVTLDGGKQTLLVQGAFNYDLAVGEEAWAAWSPDSMKLAYVRGGLHVVDRDGSDERTVSRPGEAVRSFAWRPSPLSSEGSK